MELFVTESGHPPSQTLEYLFSTGTGNTLLNINGELYFKNTPSEVQGQFEGAGNTFSWRGATSLTLKAPFSNTGDSFLIFNRIGNLYSLPPHAIQSTNSVS